VWEKKKGGGRGAITGGPINLSCRGTRKKKRSVIPGKQTEVTSGAYGKQAKGDATPCKRQAEERKINIKPREMEEKKGKGHPQS